MTAVQHQSVRREVDHAAECRDGDGQQNEDEDRGQRPASGPAAWPAGLDHRADGGAGRDQRWPDGGRQRGAGPGGDESDHDQRGQGEDPAGRIERPQGTGRGESVLRLDDERLTEECRHRQCAEQRPNGRTIDGERGCDGGYGADNQRGDQLSPIRVEAHDHQGAIGLLDGPGEDGDQQHQGRHDETRDRPGDLPEDADGYPADGGAGAAGQPANTREGTHVWPADPAWATGGDLGRLADGGCLGLESTVLSLALDEIVAWLAGGRGLQSAHRAQPAGSQLVGLAHSGSVKLAALRRARFSAERLHAAAASGAVRWRPGRWMAPERWMRIRPTMNPMRSRRLRMAP